ncbi:unnamed protein product [Echinostoma caproni]|uniref:Uncharacterized protein n=1 Tax=Echinostoma caproni TaxID=27848 RepID=A0A183ARD5_9TREM|nr:unnamed protein product [Echinostoma caproni]
MLTATRNERIDNYSPTDNPQLTGKIPTIRPDTQTQRREVPCKTMLTATRNERIDNYSPTDNPQLTGKIPTEYHNVGVVDQRISRRDRVKPVGMAHGRRGNARANCKLKTNKERPTERGMNHPVAWLRIDCI